MGNIYFRIRKKYGLSKAMLSKILGFGVNQWRLYEEGKVEPKDSHALLISMVRDPKSFKKLLERHQEILVEELGVKKFERLEKKVEGVLSEYEELEYTNWKKWVDGLYDKV